jgi:hypothetical protein
MEVNPFVLLEFCHQLQSIFAAVPLCQIMNLITNWTIPVAGRLFGKGSNQVVYIGTIFHGT